MILYIENYNIKNKNQTQKVLEKYLIKQNNIIEVYSEEGIYFIDNKNINKLIYNDKKSERMINYIDNHHFILDKTIIQKLEAYQLPFDHIVLQNTEYIYSLNNKSTIKLHLIILNMEQNFSLINDFYFEVPDNIDIYTPFFKEEINVFLSLLN